MEVSLWLWCEERLAGSPTSVVSSDLDPRHGRADVEKWMVEELVGKWNQQDWVTAVHGGRVKEREDFIMTSSFLALVTSWMVVPFVETENSKEDQKCGENNDF